MKVDEFDYNLPKEKIAQRPAQKRDSSKLLVLKRKNSKINESLFKDLPNFLKPGDLIVVNDTRVKPYRLFGKKNTGGKIEFTLVGQTKDGLWECLIKGKNPAPDMIVEMENDVFIKLKSTSEKTVRTSQHEGAPLWIVEITGDIENLIFEKGVPPLPPYIRRKPGLDPLEDHQRYQTIYAKEGKAAAAPTAGLHFTPELIEKLKQKNIELAKIRLDVSFGTFAPVRSENVEDHKMHPEYFALSNDDAAKINQTKINGGRIVAVGTTVVRTLEHLADKDGNVSAQTGQTSLYIFPGFRFKVVDVMITNFHMPKSTLLMLVSAFVGKDLLMDAYEYALQNEFRFLSYGDAMLVD